MHIVNQWYAEIDRKVMINLIGSKGKTGGIELEGPFYVNGVKMFNKNLLDVGTVSIVLYYLCEKSIQ